MSVFDNIIYSFVSKFLGGYLKNIYNLEITWHQKEPKGPFILIGNHANKGDPFLIGSNFKQHISYMANIEGVSGMDKLFAEALGCFNKQKGRSDSKSVRKTFRLIKSGRSVCIFPEGDRSWTGKTAPFPEGIVAFLKKLNVPVMVAKLTGNYLCMPRWSPNIKRKGKIFLDYRRIEKEEIAALSVNELHQKITALLDNNDFTDPRLKEITFSGKNLAIGIENLLWLCPKCRSEDTLKGRGNIITCRECGRSWEIDAKQNVSGELPHTITTAADWYEWQTNEITAIVDSKTENIPFLEDVDVELIKDLGFNKNKNAANWSSLGYGKLRLTKQGLEWQAEGCNEKIEAPFEEILNLLDNFNQFGLLNLKDERYRIFFNRAAVLKWTDFIETYRYSVSCQLEVVGIKGDLT